VALGRNDEDFGRYLFGDFDWILQSALHACGTACSAIHVGKPVLREFIFFRATPFYPPLFS
jgi:hypothetical protein